MKLLKMATLATTVSAPLPRQTAVKEWPEVLSLSLGLAVHPGRPPSLSKIPDGGIRDRRWTDSGTDTDSLFDSVLIVR